MYDMGPYYLTALVSIMGPVKRVTGSTRMTFAKRTISSEPLDGTVIEVEVPTHVNGVLDFANGAIATVITSFDVWSSTLPFIEIYGSEGTLRLPDPNTFGGPVYVKRGRDEEWDEISLSHIYDENSRGLGVADMAAAIVGGRPHRASGEMAYHVLDIMAAVHDASDSGEHVMLESTCARPAALPVGLTYGEVEL